jgi:hypothetical protein
MRTLYIEVLASHGGPESCAVVCEGGGEALAGVRAGSVLSREIRGFGVSTRLSDAEGNTVGRVIASVRRTPRGRRPGACTESPGARTGRPDVCPCPLMMSRPGWFAGWQIGVVAGREENAQAVRPR